MKQLMRRLTALFLVMAMVMSFAAVASAADEDSSIELSAALTGQENEAVLDAEDLYGEDAAEQSDQSTAADESADVSQAEAAPETGEEEAPEEQTTEAEESKTDEETPAPAPQDAAFGWATNGAGFTLTYSDGTAEAQAKGGLYAVPALTSQDGTYSFGAGVYEFDADGILVSGAYSATETPAAVTVLSVQNEALTLKASDSRSISFTGETTVEGTVVTPGAVLVSGTVDGVFYYEGAPFNGYYRATKKSILQVMTDGVAAPYSGPMVEKETLSTYLLADAEGTLDGLWYYNGKVYTGYLRSSEAENPELLYGVTKGKAEPFGGCMNEKAFSSYISNNDEDGQTEYESLGRYDKKWYVEGVAFTGWYKHPENGKIYLLNKGDNVMHQSYSNEKEYTGVMETLTIDGTTFDTYATNNQIQPNLTGLYYQKGQILTGIPNHRYQTGELAVLHMYKNGKVKDMDDGWYRAPRADKEFYQPYVYYYFKDNVAISNKENVKLKAIQQGKYKDSGSYYYTFTVTGTLVTNMYKYLASKNPSALKSAKYRIYCDHTNYTGTILMYNSKTKNFDIPFKSFVISMSKSKANSSSPTSFGTKYGNYALASGYKHWYKFKSRTTGKITMFSKSNHIWGSGSMFHGAAHKFEPGKVKGDARYMRMEASSYNRFGTAQTQHCVRVQMINMYLISKLYSSSPHFTNNGRSCAKRVRVYLTRNHSKKNMPFGQMTLLNNQDLNGYVLQEANAYGTGKDRAFEPTDYHTAGKTIYLSKSKTNKMSQCVKAKMTSYSTSGYSIEFGNA